MRTAAPARTQRARRRRGRSGRGRLAGAGGSRALEEVVQVVLWGIFLDGTLLYARLQRIIVVIFIIIFIVIFIIIFIIIFR